MPLHMIRQHGVYDGAVQHHLHRGTKCDTFGTRRPMATRRAGAGDHIERPPPRTRTPLADAGSHGQNSEVASSSQRQRNTDAPVVWGRSAPLVLETWRSDRVAHLHVAGIHTQIRLGLRPRAAQGSLPAHCSCVAPALLGRCSKVPARNADWQGRNDAQTRSSIHAAAGRGPQHPQTQQRPGGSLMPVR